MTFAQAQQEARTAFAGGAVGQLVTAIIWLVAAALGTWVSATAGFVALFAGGALIFPLTQLALRLAGRPGSLGRANPLDRFAQQSVIAFAATFPLVYIAARAHAAWFFPAFMLASGAHYIAFIMLYGMWEYGLLAGALIVAGIALLFVPLGFAAGGWLTGAILLAFALFAWRRYGRPAASSAA